MPPDDSTWPPTAAHVEGDNQDASASKTQDPSTTQIEALEDHILINGKPVALHSDELRDHMTAQIKATKIRFSSKSSIELLFYLFVAYCSTSQSEKPSITPLTNNHQTLGEPASTAPSWAP